MSVSKKLRAALALGAVLASCQLMGCGSDTVDSAPGGESGAGNTAGKAGAAQAGKAAMTGHAGAGHAGEAEAGMAGEVEMGGGNQGGSHSGGSAGLAGGGAGGAANGSKGGGAGAGAGGVSAGAGGKSGGAGTGGASPGTGGKGGGAGAGGAGTGGASAGTGGGATTTCGNNTLDAGEICDPKFSKNDCGSDCKGITSALCLACESAPNVCNPAVLTCDTAAGGTTTATVTGSSGAAKPTDPNPITTPVGSAKAPLCNELLDCIRDSGCAADAKPALTSCYCGSVSVSQCNAGMGNGLCKAQIERALETTDFATVAARAGQTQYGGGVALSRIDCDQNFCGADYQGCF